jgi:hypothetical protein
MNYFHKLNARATDISEWACQNPLRLAVILASAQRARVTDSKVLGLKKGEFIMTANDCVRFGLKPSQKGKLYRVFRELVANGIWAPTGKRYGKRQAHIYRFLANDFIDLYIAKQEAK